MQIRKIIFSILMANFLLASTINIAVATNVSYAINKLKKEFNKLNPNIKVRVILGTSGQLTSQIMHKAPFQIFMSANMKYPNSLFKKGFTITKPVVYAKGSLALLSRKDLNFSKNINILKDSKIRRVAIANPKTAPYGKASIQALKNSGIYNDIKNRLVYPQSVAQVVSYVFRSVDIGFVAKSALYSPKMSNFKKGINWVEVNLKLYTPINQGIVILKNAKNREDVKKFYNFILSEKAKNIFKEFGYLVL